MERSFLPTSLYARPAFASLCLQSTSRTKSSPHQGGSATLEGAALAIPLDGTAKDAAHLGILYNSMGINAMFSAELMAAWLANFYASGQVESFREEEVNADGAASGAWKGRAVQHLHFDRSGETAGGRGYASDFYEEQIYADLGMKLPSRDLALTRSQHDEKYYAEAAGAFGRR